MEDNNTIVFWGAGLYAERKFEEWYPIYKPVAWGDNNTEKHGTFLKGLPIFSLEEIERRYPECLFYVAIHPFGPKIEVMLSLVERGISRERVIDMDADMEAYDNASKYNLDVPGLPRPQIFPPDDTLQRLLDTSDSFARFGDGEFFLMYGGSVPFNQEFDATLQRRLREIVATQEKGLMVGIPYHFFYNWTSSGEVLRELDTRNSYGSIAAIRAGVLRCVDLSKQYGDAACTLAFFGFKEKDFDAHFAKVRSIWADKDICIICGETVFKNVGADVFDTARSVEYLYGPPWNAFSAYDDILKCVVDGVDPQKIVVIILGPTATVLAYDLHKLGYRALDLGHIAKDYYYWKKGYGDLLKTREGQLMFAEPD
ncbi:GT-D fold domain-containing protein [Synergistaceae bacterium OttesenSCG-928-I11]|nr:GT-D fold domain-containing protein [Synergistaceae bacterium OttesenSCG-928-I11]